MPKRRRLITPIKKKSNTAKQIVETVLESNKEVSTPRGRLKGALLDALDPVEEDSDTSIDQTPVKRASQELGFERDSSDDERRRNSPPRQAYVLKLFDRSVDLSQFNEDSPLYPICRAWIINQPKADYRKIGKVYKAPEDSVELPGPDGPLMSRIPELLPEQLQRSKDNINLDYREAPPPSAEALLRAHCARWGDVRRAWLRRAARVETRYADSQEVLNRINVNYT